MSNPLFDLIRYYNPLRSPITIYRRSNGTTVELRSPRRGGFEFSRSGNDNFAKALPQLNVVIGARVVSFFCSDTTLSLSHRAPFATHRDEIRLSKDIAHTSEDCRSPDHVGWEWDRLFEKKLGIFSLFVDTASRQSQALGAAVKRNALKALADVASATPN